VGENEHVLNATTTNAQNSLEGELECGAKHVIARLETCHRADAFLHEALERRPTGLGNVKVVPVIEPCSNM
jgi:hypothetical protein